MSEVEVQSSFQESLSTFSCNQSESSHKEPGKQTVTVQSAKLPEASPAVIHSAFFDLKTKRLMLNDDANMMCGDAKPPIRFSQHPPEKTPEELLRDINEKLQLNAARRERFLENIVSKSRRFIEKVQKVRDRLTRRQRETCQNTINTLYNKRQAADKMRDRLLQYKMDRIRKRLEHVTVVRGKKISNLNLSTDDVTIPHSRSPRAKIETEV